MTEFDDGVDLASLGIVSVETEEIRDKNWSKLAAGGWIHKKIKGVEYFLKNKRHLETVKDPAMYGVTYFYSLDEVDEYVEHKLTLQALQESTNSSSQKAAEKYFAKGKRTKTVSPCSSENSDSENEAVHRGRPRRKIQKPVKLTLKFGPASKFSENHSDSGESSFDDKINAEAQTEDTTGHHVSEAKNIKRCRRGDSEVLVSSDTLLSDFLAAADETFVGEGEEEQDKAAVPTHVLLGNTSTVTSSASHDELAIPKKSEGKTDEPRWHRDQSASHDLTEENKSKSNSKTSRNKANQITSTGKHTSSAIKNVTKKKKTESDSAVQLVAEVSSEQTAAAASSTTCSSKKIGKRAALFLSDEVEVRGVGYLSSNQQSRTREKPVEPAVTPRAVRFLPNGQREDKCKELPRPDSTCFVPNTEQAVVVKTVHQETTPAVAVAPEEQARRTRGEWSEVQECSAQLDHADIGAKESSRNYSVSYDRMPARREERSEAPRPLAKWDSSRGEWTDNTTEPQQGRGEQRREMDVYRDFFAPPPAQPAETASPPPPQQQLPGIGPDEAYRRFVEADARLHREYLQTVLSQPQPQPQQVFSQQQQHMQQQQYLQQQMYQQQPYSPVVMGLVPGAMGVMGGGMMWPPISYAYPPYYPCAAYPNIPLARPPPPTTAPPPHLLPTLLRQSENFCQQIAPQRTTHEQVPTIEETMRQSYLTAQLRSGQISQEQHDEQLAAERQRAQQLQQYELVGLPKRHQHYQLRGREMALRK